MARKYKKSALFKTQFFTTWLSTTLVLVLLGIIVTFVLVARSLSDYVRENINVTVLLEDDLDTARVKDITKQIELKPYARTVEYISQEQALKTLQEELGDNPEEFLGYNPLTASFEIKITADYANNDSLALVAEQLQKEDFVVDVLYEKELTAAVNRNLQRLSLILLIVASVFTYISFQLINNTVSLTIFARRFSINTMKLVGASWAFICRPFIQRALLLGVIAAVSASALLFFGIHSLKQYEPEITTVVTYQTLAIVGAAVFCFGILITTLCTYVSLRRYLRMSSNELYHI